MFKKKKQIMSFFLAVLLVITGVLVPVEFQNIEAIEAIETIETNDEQLEINDGGTFTIREDEEKLTENSEVEEKPEDLENKETDKDEETISNEKNTKDKNTQEEIVEKENTDKKESIDKEESKKQKDKDEDKKEMKEDTSEEEKEITRLFGKEISLQDFISYFNTKERAEYMKRITEKYPERRSKELDEYFEMYLNPNGPKYIGIMPAAAPSSTINVRGTSGVYKWLNYSYITKKLVLAESKTGVPPANSWTGSWGQISMESLTNTLGTKRRAFCIQPGVRNIEGSSGYTQRNWGTSNTSQQEVNNRVARILLEYEKRDPNGTKDVEMASAQVAIWMMLMGANSNSSVTTYFGSSPNNSANLPPVASIQRYLKASASDNLDYEPLQISVHSTSQNLLVVQEPQPVKPAEPTHGSIKVVKTGDSGEAVAKAGFYVRNDKGQRVRVKAVGNGIYAVATSSDPQKYDMYTNDSGTFTLRGLQAGRKYTVEEFSAPIPYSLTTDKSATIVGDKTVTINMVDKKQTGTLTLNKLDRKNSSKIDTAEFNIRKTYGGDTLKFTGSNGVYRYNPSGSVTTLRTSGGTIRVTDLPVNLTLDIVETKAPAGYDISKDKETIIFTHDKTTVDKTIHYKTVDFYNDSSSVLGQLSFSIVKKGNSPESENSFDVNLPNAEFDISVKSLKTHSILVNETRKTSSTGRISITIPGIELKDGETETLEVTLRETSVPAGYVKPTQQMKFNIVAENSNGLIRLRGDASSIQQGDFPYVDISTGVTTLTATLGNKLELGDIVITKTDKDSGDTLMGARFDIINSSGQVVDRVITNSSGIARSKKLPIGRYTVKETRAPQGYEVDVTDSKTTTVTSGNTSSLSFENTKTILNIEKRDSKTNELIQDKVVFEVLDETNSSVYFRRTGPTSYSVVSSGTTGATKEITTSTGTIKIEKLPLGDYKLVEKTQPKGYVLKDTPQNFSIVNTGNKGNKVVVLNEPNNLKLFKYDTETDKGIANTKFKITGPSFPEGKEVVTDNEGYITLDYLTEGTYTVEEVQPTNDYVLNTNTYTVTIDEQGKVTGTTRIPNKPTGFKLIKTSDLDGNVVSEVEFKLIDLSNNEEVKFDKVGSFYNYNLNGKEDRLITDKNGEIVIHYLPKGSYRIEETKNADGFIKEDLVKEFTIDDNTSVDTPLNVGLVNKVNEVELIKIDETTKERVENAVIKITGPSFPEGKEFTTDKEGKITIKQLLSGTYTYKEVKAPKGYVLNQEEQTFEVSREGVITGLLTLENKPTSVVLNKLETKSKEKIEGAKFKLIDSNKEEVLTTYDKDNNRFIVDNKGSSIISTNEEGQIRVDYLPKGKYAFVEVEAAPGFIFEAKEVEFEINDNTTDTEPATVEVLNDVVEIIITKTDSETNQFVEGSVIEIRNEEGKVLFTETTNEEGKIVIRDTSLVNGNYTFKEVKAPEGYILNEKTFEFSIDSKGVVTGDKEIVNIPTQVEIEKVDKEDNSIKLDEVQFQIKNDEGLTMNFIKENGYYKYSEEGTIDTIETNSKGLIDVRYLPLGKYNLTETLNKDGYILNTEVKTFEITEETFVNEPLEIVVENKPVVVELIKTDFVNAEPVPGATIVITGPSFPEGKEFITDEEGKVIIDKPISGEYTFKEKIHPEGYVLNTESFTFVVNRDGSIEGNFEFKNEPTSLRVLKLEKDTDIVLSNTKFEIHTVDRVLEDEEGNETTLVKMNYDSDNSRYVANAKGEFSFIETSKEGEVRVDYLPQGKYKLIEIASKPGYVLDSTPIEFEITEETGVTSPFVIEKENKPVEVTLSKTDITTGKPVEGAEIIITGPSFPEGESFITDENGKIKVTHLVPGDYVFKEKIHPEGYVLNTESFTFTVKEDGTIEGDVDLVNDPTSLEVVKQEVETGTKLEDTYFEIHVVDRELEDEEGNLSTLVKANYDEELNRYVANANGEFDKLVTNEEGTFRIDYLPQGKYELREVLSKDGYILDKEPVEFEITEETSTTTPLEITKENKPVIVEILKTDKVTGKGVEGAKVLITGPSFPEGKEFTTDEEGLIVIERPLSGEYSYKEIEHPEGYILNTEVFEFIVNRDGTLEGSFSFSNEPTSVELIKKEEGTDTVLEDTTFELYRLNEEESIEAIETIEAEDIDLIEKVTISLDEENNRYVFDDKSEDTELITNEEGKIRVDYLPQGKYMFKEIKSSDGYVLDNKTIEFEITEETGVEKPILLEMENAPIVVEITKTDFLTKKVVEGSTILITGPSFPEGEEFTTDENGLIRLERVLKGDYTYKEIKEPNGYTLNEETFEFKVTEEGIVEGTLSFENKPTKVEVVKKDNNGKLLSGVEFNVLDSNGNKVKFSYNEELDAYVVDLQGSSTLKTNSKGQFNILYLTKGKYDLVETKGLAGYEKLTKPISFEITDETDVEKPAQLEVINNLIPDKPSHQTGDMDYRIVVILLVVAMVTLISLVIYKRRKNI